MVWNAANLRFTAFLSDVDPRGASDALFAVLSGNADPVSIRFDKASAGKVFESEDGLSLQIQPGVIHAVQARATATPDEATGGLQVDTLGNLTDSTRGFHALVDPLIARVADEFPDKTNRIAFGAEAFWPLKLESEGYELLRDRFLQERIKRLDPHPSNSDFSYQLNVRTVHEGVAINRLSRWSVTQITGVAVARSEPDRKIHLGVPMNMVRVVLDINTVPDSRITDALLPELWQTLVRLGVSVAEEGVPNE